MRRVLVLTWALGTATGVLLGLFGVELVSSRFSTAGVSPLSRPEVLRALQAARSEPPAGGVALPAPSTPDTAVPPPSPAVDADPARPSAGSGSSSAPPPASTLPRPGTAETFVDAGAPASTTSTAPPEPSTTTSTAAPAPDGEIKPKSDSKGSNKSGRPSTSSSPATTTTSKKTTTTTTPPAPPRPSQPPQQQAGTQTINSAGGVVAVRYSGGKVELKWARPNAGYQVYVRSNGPDQVIVYFYTRNRVSQVVAYYNNGTPAQAVQEYSGSNQSGNH